MLMFFDWKFYLIIAVAVAVTASSVFFWRIGKEEAIRLIAQKEGYNLGVDEAFEEFQRGQKIAKKLEKQRQASAAHFGGIHRKLEDYHAANPVPVSCNIADERLQLLNSALAGPPAASEPDRAVSTPDPAEGRGAENVRPDDERERAEASRLREPPRPFD
jgi:hypothetical protein